uniref:guanylate cyclase n=1 Tax=Acrobeloides nanus TaxID=290746 RepID=A0A914CF12_9BILA
MFGWIHESFRQLVNRKYGHEIWLKILELAKFEEGTESEIGHYYKDEDTMRIVNAMANTIGFLIQFTMETGWDELLRAMAPDLEGFLDGLDALHYFIDHIVYRTKLKGPSFRCEPQKDGTLLLHYYSRRSGLYPIVKGVVREVARRIYEAEVIMKVAERKQEHLDENHVTEHVVFVITQVETSANTTSKAITSKPVTNVSLDFNTVYKSGQFIMKLDDFCDAFPHHFCFNRDLVLEHVGTYVKKAYPWIKGGETRLVDVLDLIHPEIPLTYDSIRAFRNSLFVFQMKESAEQTAGTTVTGSGSASASMSVMLK